MHEKAIFPGPPLDDFIEQRQRLLGRVFPHQRPPDVVFPFNVRWVSANFPVATEFQSIGEFSAPWSCWQVSATPLALRPWAARTRAAFTFCRPKREGRPPPPVTYGWSTEINPT